MKNILFITLAFFSFISCSEDKKKEIVKKEKETEIETDFLAVGRKISKESQKTLFQHVGGAMKMGGPLAAIQYCNINAMAITDSLSDVFNVAISRITDQNRNETNVLKEDDFSVWEYYKSGEINVQLGDTLIEIDGKNTYYKPIYIANPVCLNCHGKSGSDIMDFTLAKIEEYYPNDKAKEYNLGELRGMWKIEFSE